MSTQLSKAPASIPFELRYPLPPSLSVLSHPFLFLCVNIKELSLQGSCRHGERMKLERIPSPLSGHPHPAVPRSCLLLSSSLPSLSASTCLSSPQSRWELAPSERGLRTGCGELPVSASPHHICLQGWEPPREYFFYFLGWWLRRKVVLEPAVSGVERLRAEKRWVGSSL